MARKPTPASGGIEIRESSIRVLFTLNGVRKRETLKLNGEPMPPTAANIKHATRLSAEIRQAIKTGMFDYARYFPDSKDAPPPAVVKTFGDLADDWLDSKGRLQDATLDQYTNAVGVWKRLIGETTPIDKLSYQLLAAVIGKHKWASAKSANNYLIVLRGVIAFEFHGPRATLNPMLGIQNMKVVKKIPDPLTADERDRILADMQDRYGPRVRAYFQFAFFTGMRPEELIALQWGDYDRASGTIRVQRVRTFRGSEREGSKTDTVRDVDLTSPAIEALELMRPLTQLKGGCIFENPVTGEPWHDERSQRDTFWKPCLTRLGIRYRRAYNTRHTYATVALMGGVNPAYIARQLGHANTKMLFDVYARWIDGADKGVQRNAMEAAMAPKLSLDCPQGATDSAKLLISNGKSGRRDWTRT